MKRGSRVILTNTPRKGRTGIVELLNGHLVRVLFDEQEPCQECKGTGMRTVSTFVAAHCVEPYDLFTEVTS